MIADILKTMSFSFRQLFLFELVYKTLTLFIFIPSISIIFNRMLGMGGYAGATNHELLRFVFSRYGLLCLLILVPVATVLIFLELAVLIIISYYGNHRRKIGVIPAFSQALGYLPSLFKYGFVGWAIYLVLLLPFISDGLGPALLPSLEIPNFITGELMKTGKGSILYFGTLILLLLVGMRLTFLLHVMIIEGKSGFWQAAKRSGVILRKSYIKMLIVTVLTLFFFTVIVLIILFVLLALLVILHLTMPEHAVYAEAVKTILSKGTVLSLYLATLIVVPLYMTTLTRLYISMTKPEDAVLNLSDTRLEGAGLSFLERGLLRKHRRKLVGLLLMVGLVTAFILMPAISDVNPLENSNPTIMAHRGYVAKGAENTIESVQGAIEAGADYAEIDILETKDGQLAVIHDTELKRLTGHSGNVYDMTMDELRELTITQGQFTGKISSLEEVMEVARGRIKLNIEVKTHGKEQNLVPAFLKTIRDHNFIEECVVTSLDYGIIQQIKAEEPRLKVGYIMFAGRPQMERIEVDFVVMEEYMVKKSVVAAAQLHHKPIYVWTVNDVEKMERYFSMGVDGIVTDYPEEALEIVRTMQAENEEDPFWTAFIKWINELPTL